MMSGERSHQWSSHVIARLPLLCCELRAQKFVTEPHFSLLEVTMDISMSSFRSQQKSISELFEDTEIFPIASSPDARTFESRSQSPRTTKQPPPLRNRTNKDAFNDERHRHDFATRPPIDRHPSLRTKQLHASSIPAPVRQSHEIQRSYVRLFSEAKV